MLYCGLDISSVRIGISVINDLEEIILSQTYKFTDLDSQFDKRMILKNMVMKVLKSCKLNIIFLEEVRLFSYGGKGNYFISEKAIFRLLSLIITLMNEEIKVYKINSRSWKSRILRGPKKVLNKQKNKKSGTDKQESVKFIQEVYNINVNHDQADSICIAIYARRFGEEMAKLID